MKTSLRIYFDGNREILAKFQSKRPVSTTLSRFNIAFNRFLEECPVGDMTDVTKPAKLPINTMK